MKDYKFKTTVILIALCLGIYTQPIQGEQGSIERDQKQNQQKVERLNTSHFLSMLDINHYNNIDKKETSKDNKFLLRDFSSIDTNQDDELDLEELKAFHSQNDEKRRKRTKEAN